MAPETKGKICGKARNAVHGRSEYSYDKETQKRNYIRMDKDEDFILCSTILRRHKGKG
jgi:hypothetical protein